MGLKVCGQVFNLGTILGKRMEWRQFEICDISKWTRLNLDLCASTSLVRSYDSFASPQILLSRVEAAIGA